MIERNPESPYGMPTVRLAVTLQNQDRKTLVKSILDVELPY